MFHWRGRERVWFGECFQLVWGHSCHRGSTSLASSFSPCEMWIHLIIQQRTLRKLKITSQQMISAVQVISRPSNANTLQTFKLFLTRLSGCSSHKWIRKKFLISEEAHELSHPPSSDYRIFLCFLGSGCKDKREQMNQVQSMLSSEKGGIEGVGG